MEMEQIKVNLPEGYGVYNIKSEYKKTAVVIDIFKTKAVEEKKPELPKKWEEIEEIEGWYVDDISEIVRYSQHDTNFSNWNTLPTEELAEAMLALCQLLYLRDIYRQGWKPDWAEYSIKYGLYNKCGQINTCTATLDGTVISFQTAEIRDLFLENFRDLLEQAKELL